MRDSQSFCSWCEKQDCKCEYNFHRAVFAEKLETYAVPRPKTYADRKWLEGYSETARTIEPTILSCHKERWIVVALRVARERVREMRIKMQKKDLTARGAGQIDAWLDAVGC